MSEAAYVPSDWGRLYMNLPYDEVLGAGSAGPGKTTVLLAEVLPRLLIEHERCSNPKHPYPLKWGQSKGWAIHLRRTLPMLKQSIIRARKMFQDIDPDVRWSEEDHTFIFQSGYRYQFAHCKDAGSWVNYVGPEYDLILYDELVQFLEEQFLQINTRLRSDDPVLSTMLKIRAMSNPMMEMEAQDSFAVVDPHWVRRYFVDPAPTGKTVLEYEFDLPDGTKQTRTRMYLPATIHDNPNKAFVSQYMKNLAAKPRHIREALLSGNWYYTAGAYYGEHWSERLHTCMPFRIPEDWPIFRSMDWGYKHHGCVHWWALGEDDNLYCIRELTFLGKQDIEVAKMVRDIEEKMGLWRENHSVITGPADTQLWEERGATGRNMAGNFAAKGVTWAKADKGHSRQRNAERLLTRLKDHKDETTNPGIVFFRNCPQAIRTIPMILTDKTHPWLPQDGGDDHWHDSVLYACAYAARGRAGIAPPRRRRESWEEKDDRASSAKVDHGQFGYGMG